MKISFRCLVIISMSFAFFSKLNAQDTHYASQQFGTRTALLSGAILGGIDDNSMVFYNPGGLGLLENTSLSVNANAYRIENIKIFNALGDRADFKSSNLGTVPLLAGGMIKLKDPKWKLGYGFMAPTDFSFKGIARVDGDYDVIEEAESPGLEELVGESSLTSKLSEVLFAFGAGRVISENFSVGASALFTVRSQTYNRNYSAYIFLNDVEESLVGGNLSQNVDYYNIRMALKLGAIYKMESWSFGATFTTPSLNIGGQGTVASNIAARNVKFNGVDRQSGVATDRQAELKTKFKSPLQIGVGVNYDQGKSFLGLSVNYYSGLDSYEIMDVVARTFVRPADLAPELSSDQFLSVRGGARSVVNVALGYEYRLKDHLSLLASVRNDMSYYDKDKTGADNGGIKTTVSSWDLLHFTAGAIFKRENSSLSLGLLYSTGTKDDYEQKGNLNNPTEGSLLKGATTITEAKYSSIGLLLGYTYFFKKF